MMPFFVSGLLVAAFVLAMCRAAAKPVPRIQTIGRRSYAEGRPTMPSTPEPEDERARRRAPIYNWPYGGPHQTK